MSAYSFAGGNPTPAASVTLTNTAFFPDIKTDDFVTLYRIPSEIDTLIIQHQLKHAMSRVNRSLKSWRSTQQNDGNATLAAVPADEIGGESELLQQYLRAVYCEAKAELLKETETVDRRATAENYAKAGEETEDKYREFAAQEIRAIVGLNRVGVNLI
ncbi:MAG: head completion/stabilization protein [Motiliproteus sp.]